MSDLDHPIRRRSMVVTITAALILAAIPTAVWAADRFNDVPDSNIFHEDIAWLAEKGVTRGCNPPDNDQFCPDDNVTREQMAAFMHRLGDSLLEDAVVGANTGLEAQLAAVNLATAAYQDVEEAEGPAMPARSTHWVASRTPRWEAWACTTWTSR